MPQMTASMARRCNARSAISAGFDGGPADGSGRCHSVRMARLPRRVAAIQPQVRPVRAGLSEHSSRIERMFDTLAPTELVLAIADSQRQESIVVARRLAAVAELLGQRTAEVEAEDPDRGYMVVTGFQRTSAEVAAACNLSPATASVMVSH